ncbi:hypothetical protein ES332_D12G062300v1 [Gossypium tomentosum]|uniref:Uncharacterized protein n=1 Tax=Gossypium tomentosum TaxID=34277 RepID=A0A5D2I595_GOSTO|nr:hypothetical protein ES332_D12G062300v1 [Gossypium tomentosum]
MSCPQPCSLYLQETNKRAVKTDNKRKEEQKLTVKKEKENKKNRKKKKFVFFSYFYFWVIKTSWMYPFSMTHMHSIYKKIENTKNQKQRER